MLADKQQPLKGNGSWQFPTGDSANPAHEAARATAYSHKSEMEELGADNGRCG